MLNKAIIISKVIFFLPWQVAYIYLKKKKVKELHTTLIKSVA